MLYLICLFIFGTVVGSFLNVCIHRLPRGRSIILPPSCCPGCGQKLSLADLIPILGYVFLKGKCRHCRTSISIRYPLVEFLCGSLFILVKPFFPAPLDFIFNLIFISFLIVVFFVDLEHYVIPDVVSVGGIVIGLGYSFTRGFLHKGGWSPGPFFSAFGGVLLGFVIFFLIARVGKIVFKKEVMGEGDIYLVAMLGAFLGWQGVLLSIFMAYLLAGAIILPLLAFGKIKTGEYVPFGPALAVGGILSSFFGQGIIEWYLGLFI